ncbi:DUF1802 family protein [Opitutaceae bacterium]
MAPAFKEWQAIVGALVAGAQSLILRKGGIAEGRGGFKARDGLFWLFPTGFHAQHEKTKPAAARWFPSGAPATEITLTGFANVHKHVFLDDWPRIQALDPHHLWTEATVRERFDWAKPPGLHVFVVRVHQLRTPVRFSPTPEMAGCRSWIDLPFAFADHPADPVLNDASFAARVKAIGL